MLDWLLTIGFLAMFLGVATWSWLVLRKANDRRWRLLGHIYFVLCLLASLVIVVGQIFLP